MNKPSNSTGYREQFSKNLRYHMKRKGVTIMDVSKAMGVAYSAAHGWASGVQYPRPDKIKELAEYFGITTAELIEGAGDTNDKINAIQLRAALKARPELKTLFDLSQKAEARDIEAAIQMLAALTKGKE